ncbi:MAG: DUF296 domain-containing protein [Fibrobacter sp.]|jgi:predicted DNA-binding protein with PD1-like motif|nr:DUF296 domain-containing protein [Fibrobacter sp.]
MQYSSGSTGRTFVLRFEENDTIYKEIENLCEKESVEAGVIWIIGGVKNGGVVVGPGNDSERPLRPQVEQFTEAHEIIGTGTIFRNEENKPVLHMHAGAGRGKHQVIGCPRKGLECWLVTEAVLLEIKGALAGRVKDESGAELLKVLKK